MRQSYRSDLTDEQWEVIKTLIPPAKTGGRPRTVDMRRVIDGIFYVLMAGCAWCLLPHDFPKWKTVYHYFRQWRINGDWEQIHEQLRKWVRAIEDHHRSPSAAVLDSQSVKTAMMIHTEKGFKILPRRWIVERTFGWFNWCRRLNKDYEVLPATSETMIRVAMIRLMLRRLA